MFGHVEDYTSDEKALALVFDALEASEESLEPLFEKWRRNELLYWSKRDATMWKNVMGATNWENGTPFESSLLLPTVLQQVESQVPRIALSLSANDPMVRAKPLLNANETLADENTAWTEAEAKERFLHNQAVRDVKIRRRLGPWLRPALLHGTKILSLDWVTRNGPDWQQIQKTAKASNGRTVETGVWEFTKGEDILLEDRIRVSGDALWDIFPDPRGQTFRSEDGVVCRYVVRRRIMDIDDFMAFVKATPTKPWWYKRTKSGEQAKNPNEQAAYEQLKKLQGLVKGEHNKTASILAEVGRLAGGSKSSGKATARDKKLLLIHDYWEPAGGFHIMTVGVKGNGLCVLREENPFKILGLPFVTVSPIPLDKQIYGLGICDMIEHLVYWVDALTNLHMTGAIREANPLVVFDSMSGLNLDEMIAQPYLPKMLNGQVPLDQCMKVLPFPAVGAAAYQEREFAMTQLESAAGSSEFSMSGDPGRNVTARGIQSFLQENALRFNLEVLATGECLCELFEGMDALNRQFITTARLERFVGKTGQDRFMSVTPEMLKRPVELEFDARPESANPAMRMQQMLQWLSVWRDHPNFNADEALVESAKLQGMPRPRRFLKQQFTLPELENEIFRQSVAAGHPTMGEVLPNDSDEEHIQVHDVVFTDGTVDRGGDEAKRVALKHVMAHVQQGQQGQPAGQPTGPEGPPQAGVEGPPAAAQPPMEQPQGAQLE